MLWNKARLVQVTIKSPQISQVSLWTTSYILKVRAEKWWVEWVFCVPSFGSSKWNIITLTSWPWRLMFVHLFRIRSGLCWFGNSEWSGIFFFFYNSEYITYQWDLKGEGLAESKNKPLTRPFRQPSYAHVEKGENWKEVGPLVFSVCGKQSTASSSLFYFVNSSIQ